MSDVTFESVLAQAEQLDAADKMRLMDHLAQESSTDYHPRRRQN